MALMSISEVKVGLIVILSIVLLVALTISVGNLQESFADTIKVRFETDTVLGLENYAPITYAGVRIGRVVNLEYDTPNHKAVITGEIQRDSAVALDSRVDLTATGLLTSLSINIEGGSGDLMLSSLIASGSSEDEIVLPANPYISIFSMGNDARSTLEKVNHTLDGIQEPIQAAGDIIEDMSQHIKIILNDLDGMLVKGDGLIEDFLGEATGLVTEASAQVIPALKDVRKTAAEFPEIVGNVRTRLDSVLENADGMLTEARPEVLALMKDVRTSVAALQERIQTVEKAIVKVLDNTDSILVDNRGDIDAILDYLRSTSQNLDNISQQISKNPWRLVWKTDEPEVPERVSPDWKPAALERITK